MKRMTIRLNFNNYPLYVGDTSDFPYRYGRGADIDIIAEVNSGVYTADNITWTVSNPEIVSLTVKDNATVTVKALRTGFASVTASLPDGTSESCYIPVIDNYNRFQTARIVLNADKLILAKGTSANLSAILYPKDVLENNPVTVDKSLAWESLDDEIASVNENGVVCANENGTTKITVKSNDVGRLAVCAVTVCDSINTTGIEAEQSETVNMTVGEMTTLNPAVFGGGKIIWRSENSYIADVDQNGVVTAYGRYREIGNG